MKDPQYFRGSQIFCGSRSASAGQSRNINKLYGKYVKIKSELQLLLFRAFLSPQGFLKENLQLHKSPSLVPSLPPVSSLPLPSLPFLPLPSPPVPSPFQRESGGITPGKFLELEMLVGEF